MSTTRREILKAAPLALLSGGFAIPLLSAFTEDDLKKAEKGKVIKQEPKSIEVTIWNPAIGMERFKDWTVFANRAADILTLGSATLDEHPCEIVGISAFKDEIHWRWCGYRENWYMLHFQDLVDIDWTKRLFMLSQTI